MCACKNARFVGALYCQVRDDIRSSLILLMAVVSPLILVGHMEHHHASEGEQSSNVHKLWTKKSSQRNKWSEEGVVSANGAAKGGTSILQPSHSHNVPRTICEIKCRDNYKLQSEWSSWWDHLHRKVEGWMSRGVDATLFSLVLQLQAVISCFTAAIFVTIFSHTWLTPLYGLADSNVPLL